MQVARSAIRGRPDSAPDRDFAGVDDLAPSAIPPLTVKLISAPKPFICRFAIHKWNDFQAGIPNLFNLGMAFKEFGNALAAFVLMAHPYGKVFRPRISMYAVNGEASAPNIP